MADDDFEAKHPRDEHGRFGLSAWADKKLGEHFSIAQGMGVREATPKEFKSAFDAAFKDSKYSAFVTHYTPEQLKGMKLYLSKDGKAGLAVHDHGDGRIEGTALFNTGGVKNGGLAMLAHTVVHDGVNYAECYGPALNMKYETLGFKEHERFPFDPKQAAPGWDTKLFGTPDYITMKRP